VDINEFLLHPCGTATVLGKSIRYEEDRVSLYYLIDHLIERAAKLTAINLSSVVLKEGGGKTYYT